MKKQDFNFTLPESLIAQYPLPERTDSRLLVYNKAARHISHHTFKHIVDFLEPGDLLVLNDSKVMPARLFGQKPTGGKVELLIARIQAENRCLAHMKPSKSIKPGMVIQLEQGWFVRILERQGDVFLCEANGSLEQMLEAIGHIPLPLYIRRLDGREDRERYQTVYADQTGSVAAPTAGLHFDTALLEKIRAKGVQVGSVTLHVGVGTFRPVRTENILDHAMHTERFEVTQALCDQVNATKRAGHRVIAVGTTALRTLESAAYDGVLQPGTGETDIFIYPGYRFQIIDGLLTNFHLPESTLLMLVCAWIGHAEAMSLYQQAIAEGYRFFSYGDASLLL